jgi:hypothetical protein
MFSDWFDGPNYFFNASDPQLPRYRLHHYLTKSVEHLVKKWVRGTADGVDAYGRPAQRPVTEIVEWTKRFASDWTVVDESALNNSVIIRDILYNL